MPGKHLTGASPNHMRLEGRACATARIAAVACA